MEKDSWRDRHGAGNKEKDRQLESRTQQKVDIFKDAEFSTMEFNGIKYDVSVLR